MRIYLACALVLTTTGCPTPVCPTLATRCSGQVIELCGSDGQWQTVLDCTAITIASGGSWECATTREDGQEINTCLPTEAP